MAEFMVTFLMACRINVVKGISARADFSCQANFSDLLNLTTIVVSNFLTIYLLGEFHFFTLPIGGFRGSPPNQHSRRFFLSLVYFLNIREVCWLMSPFSSRSDLILMIKVCDFEEIFFSSL